MELQHDLMKENNTLTAAYNKSNILLSGFNDLKPFVLSLQGKNNELKLKLKTCDKDRFKLLQTDKMALI